jgi:plastocyanin
MKTRFRKLLPLVAATAVLAAVLVPVACGGSSGYSSSNPATPSPVGGGGGAATTIAIEGIRGGQSFSPDPASASQGSTIAWTNNDSVTHHIVFDDGSLDTGDIAPGASSQVKTMGSNGARYHCTIHPSMVGAINMSTGAPPPCTGAYCDSSK